MLFNLKCFSKLVLLFFLILFLSLNVFAIADTGEIKIFAVTEKNDGIIADLLLYTIPGNGEVAFVTSNSLVGKDTQLTGNIALTVAQKELNVSIDYKNFVFDIKANASEVDGPSAGAAMTLLAYSVLSEKPLNKKVGITGTINSDGSVGVVGGIGAKAKIASENGIELLMIPSGQAVTYVKDNDGKSKSVNLLSYGPETLGLKIIEVSNINDVIKFAYSNIDEIEVDYISGTSNFIPESISFKSNLFPMVDISKKYIERAKNTIDRAEKELETSSLDDAIKASFYTQLGKAKRDVELSQIYLDQNYLYSAANYSFNADVSAGTIELIASMPSLLSINSKILDLKVGDLRKEIADIKKEMNFLPVNDLEWLIGAQQRIAYAENALNNIYVNYDDLELNELELDEELLQYSKVKEFISAQQWLQVSKDFFEKAKKSSLLKTPFFSEDFILKTKAKINSVQVLIDNSEINELTKSEVLRRLNSSKISFDNNFYFAALYDAFFAESFFSAEIKRSNLLNPIKDEIEELKLLIIEDNFESLWANLFFDHAIFFIKNSDFEKSLGREQASQSILETVYDLMILSKNIESVKNQVFLYMNETEMESFVLATNSNSDPIMEITYVRKENSPIYTLILVICLLLLLLVFVLIGIGSRRTHGFRDASKSEKINFLLNRLDRALSQKKINDAEYFFLKKKYDDEYKLLNDFREERSKITLNLDESKTKLNALQNGLKDLKKHYKAGLIIPDDYVSHLSEVNTEIVNIKQRIKELELDLHENRHNILKQKIVKEKNDKHFNKKTDNVDSEFNVKGTNKNNLSYSEFDIKGTYEKESEVLDNAKKERVIRRKLLKKFKKNKK